MKHKNGWRQLNCLRTEPAADGSRPDGRRRASARRRGVWGSAGGLERAASEIASEPGLKRVTGVYDSPDRAGASAGSMAGRRPPKPGWVIGGTLMTQRNLDTSHRQMAAHRLDRHVEAGDDHGRADRRDRGREGRSGRRNGRPRRPRSVALSRWRLPRRRRAGSARPTWRRLRASRRLLRRYWSIRRPAADSFRPGAGAS